ncbi:MAG: hypothetical protein AUH46_00090 [Gemmatimonadetes bacterium 13_1_40CM_70_15]|nr:MAG: hypothetical protein AUH46_00090 [Gemmatimonadetes bacterium 13_1_40CM_70_15]
MIALTCTVGACERHDQAASRAVLREAMHGVLAYPRSTLVSMTAGSDAGQLEFTSPDAVDTVAGWFRLALPMNGWTLQSDAKAADGTVSIYAQKGNKPLWISLKPSVGAPGTTYTMIGATVDSTKADSGR